MDAKQCSPEMMIVTCYKLAYLDLHCLYLHLFWSTVWNGLRPFSIGLLIFIIFSSCLKRKITCAMKKALFPAYVNSKWQDINSQRLAPRVKFSADDILKYADFPQKTGFDISWKLSPWETIRMKCQILFSRKNKKNIISLSSAELAQRWVIFKAPS